MGSDVKLGVLRHEMGGTLCCMTSNSAFYVIYVMKLAKISERTPPLAERTPPRRAVEEGRARCRWTGNSLLHLIKPFLAEFPSAVDHGIDVCVAVHCLSWRCHLDSTLRTQSMQRAVCKQ